jgi:hypothetical protein
MTNYLDYIFTLQLVLRMARVLAIPIYLPKTDNGRLHFQKLAMADNIS